MLKPNYYASMFLQFVEFTVTCYFNLKKSMFCTCCVKLMWRLVQYNLTYPTCACFNCFRKLEVTATFQNLQKNAAQDWRSRDVKWRPDMLKAGMKITRWQHVSVFISSPFNVCGIHFSSHKPHSLHVCHYWKWTL